MSDERDPEYDQTAPVAVDGEPAIQDLVKDDIETRKQHGIRKYGTALQIGNGRSMLLDAYEEALDLCVYLRGLIEIEQRFLRQSCGKTIPERSTRRDAGKPWPRCTRSASHDGACDPGWPHR